MSNKVRVRLLIVIATVWAVNSVVLPLLIKGWTPDPMINGVFTLVAGAVFAQQPKPPPHDSEHPRGRHEKSKT